MIGYLPYPTRPSEHDIVVISSQRLDIARYKDSRHGFWLANSKFGTVNCKTYFITCISVRLLWNILRSSKLLASLILLAFYWLDHQAVEKLFWPRYAKSGYLFVCSFICSFVRLFVRLFVCLFVRLFVHLFVRLFVHLFVRSFVCSFVLSFLRFFPLALARVHQQIAHGIFISYVFAFSGDS